MKKHNTWYSKVLSGILVMNLSFSSIVFAEEQSNIVGEPITGNLSAVATSQNKDCPAEYAIDGDPNTFWHAEWSPNAGLPQSITIDLGDTYTVCGLRYTPRQDGLPNGNIMSYNIYFSEDGDTFAFLKNGNLEDSADQKTIEIPPINARAIRLEVLAGIANYASAAELVPLKAPDGVEAQSYESIAKDLSVPIEGNFTATVTSKQSEGMEQALFDGDLNTMWHTNWTNPDKLPQYVTIDLGQVYNLSGIKYIPRQDGNTNGCITKYNISTSTDGQNYNTVASGEWEPTSEAKIVNFDDKLQVQYIKIEALDGVSGYASAAEIQPLENLWDSYQNMLNNKITYTLKIGSPEIEVQKGDEEVEKITMAAAPLIENDTTLIPLRGLFESMGATVEWNDISKQVRVEKDGDVILFMIGYDYAFKNLNKVKLEAIPQIVEGDSTVIPLRFVSEAMGYSVKWVESEQKIIISK